MSSYDRNFRKMLQANHVSVGELCSSATCEEVPLYSRYSELRFLRHLSVTETNYELLHFSLTLLAELTSALTVTSRFFTAITLWDGGASEPIVPSIFVCSDTTKYRLKSLLKLQRASSSFGKGIRSITSKIENAGFVVLEEDSADGTARVFVGQKSALKPNQLTVSELLVSSYANRHKRLMDLRRSHLASLSKKADAVAGIRSLSKEYFKVAKILDKGWKGTYGELAVKIGKQSDYARQVGQIVKAYSNRNPKWPRLRVKKKVDA